MFRHTRGVHRINKCKICLRTFESADELKAHSFVNKCKQLCALCGASVVNIRQHIKNNHISNKLCSVCGLSVRNINQHMKSHKPKTPCKCSVCDKILATKVT